MDNGHNQVGGFNQEVFQGEPTANPFVTNPDLRATGNKILNSNPESAPEPAETAEMAPQIGGEMPRMGEIVDLAAPEIPGTITSFNTDVIRTDKKTGLSDAGVQAVDNAIGELEKSGDTNGFYATVREGMMPANMKSFGKEIGKAA